MGNNIPEMFARIYTAAPPEVIWDMFENDSSFDEASQKQMDRQMDADLDPFADFMMDDPMEDEYAVEKAIYQEGIRKNTNQDVGGIETPYGLGLEEETLTMIAAEFPGIKAIAGVELDDFNDIFNEAELFVTEHDPEIEELLDKVEHKAEVEGSLNLLPDVTDAVGVNIETAERLKINRSAAITTT